MKIPRVIQITDRRVLTREALNERVMRGGEDFAVQLRDPGLHTTALLELGKELRRWTRAVGAQLFVNDRLDVARYLKADGVHLGRSSVTIGEARAFLGPVVVTCSAHSVEESVLRAEQGADAVLLSPIFTTPGKGAPLGLGALREARRQMSPGVALIALGGLDAHGAAAAIAQGAAGVAGIRADLTAILLSPVR